MARLLKRSLAADTKLTCGGTNNTEIPVHSSIITARSAVLANMISPLVEQNSETESNSKSRENSETEPQTKNVEKEQSGNSDVCVYAVEERVLLNNHRREKACA